MERLGILISGGGTTMNEMIQAVQTRKVDGVELACIVASTNEAGGILKATNLNIPADNIVVVSRQDYKHYPTKQARSEAFGKRILQVLNDNGVTQVTQNGWLPKTPDNVINAFEGRIYNQHPGPPEDFGEIYGRQVHKAILEFCRLTKQAIYTEAVAHRVTNVVDGGAVVLANRVEIDPFESVESLQAKVLPVEHATQIQLLQNIVEGTVTELKRTRIVSPEQEHLLAQAKKLARDAYKEG